MRSRGLQSARLRNSRQCCFFIRVLSGSDTSNCFAFLLSLCLKNVFLSHCNSWNCYIKPEHQVNIYISLYAPINVRLTTDKQQVKHNGLHPTVSETAEYSQKYISFYFKLSTTSQTRKTNMFAKTQ